MYTLTFSHIAERSPYLDIPALRRDLINILSTYLCGALIFLTIHSALSGNLPRGARGQI